MKFNGQTFSEYKDMFNIYNLITKINKYYKLYFDSYDKLFKIINTANNNEICLKTNNLSPTILKNLQKSRIENIDKILEDIEDNNNCILSKNQAKLKYTITEKMIDVLALSKRATSISNTDIKKILGEKA